MVESLLDYVQKCEVVVCVCGVDLDMVFIEMFVQILCEDVVVVVVVVDEKEW